MQFSSFISGLINEGEVTVMGNLVPFTQADSDATLEILKHYYNRDVLEMPYNAPAFNNEAALWAAQYLYISTQLTVLRHLGEDEVNEALKPFGGSLSAEVIYSADLVLRYMPQLYHLAKGLSPADILVKKMQNTAAYWPFSSIGIEVTETFNTDIILAHPSLKYSYTDRIIKSKDLKRAMLDEEVKNTVTEVLGAHAASLWPKFVLEN